MSNPEDEQNGKEQPTYGNINFAATPRADLINNISSFSKHQESFTIKDFCRSVDFYSSIGYWTDELAARVAKAKLTGKAAKLLKIDGDLNSATKWSEF